MLHKIGQQQRIMAQIKRTDRRPISVTAKAEDLGRVAHVFGRTGRIHADAAGVIVRMAPVAKVGEAMRSVGTSLCQE